MSDLTSYSPVSVLMKLIQGLNSVQIARLRCCWWDNSEVSWPSSQVILKDVKVPHLICGPSENSTFSLYLWVPPECPLFDVTPKK